MKVTVIAVRTNDMEEPAGHVGNVLLRMREELPPLPVYVVTLDLTAPVHLDKVIDEGLGMIRKRIVDDLYISEVDSANITRGQVLKRLLLAVEGKSDEQIEEMAKAAAATGSKLIVEENHQHIDAISSKDLVKLI